METESQSIEQDDQEESSHSLLNKLRRQRALSQNLLLLEERLITHGIGVEYSVLGTRNEPYMVEMQKQVDEQVKWYCSCRDFLFRHKQCKHIYFVRTKALGDGKQPLEHAQEWKVACTRLACMENNMQCMACFKKVVDEKPKQCQHCKHSIHQVCWERCSAKTVHHCIHCGNVMK